MQIQLRFFASLREAVGTAQESLELPADVTTAGQVRDYLCSRGGSWAEALAEGRSLRIACNQQMAEPSTPVTEGCELAFFPPVTGG
ncbi:MAG: molybdopterin converting factor subunit 1 [Pseudomonadota bacterium]|jgi:sulfur-carrier protein|nr:molybdopterin converting factor subunit 1 [Oxalobacteraceae bacterium]